MCRPEQSPWHSGLQKTHIFSHGDNPFNEDIPLLIRQMKSEFGQFYAFGEVILFLSFVLCFYEGCGFGATLPVGTNPSEMSPLRAFKASSFFAMLLFVSFGDRFSDH